jgi:hypothetical protein
MSEIAIILLLVMVIFGFIGWAIAKDQECYAVCKRENELRKEFCDIADQCGNKYIYADPCLTECVCR